MNIESVKIEKLEDVLGKYIEKTQKVIDSKYSRLTAPGENFGSTIIKLDLTLQDDDNKETKELSVVAKLLPALDFFRELFNVQVTFKLEAAFYDIIIPTLQNFQRQQGIEKVIDFFPKFYGARMNLNGSDKIDDDAVILLENLKVSGYYNLDRQLGCDLENAKLILRDLAKFHAVPIALKLKKPAVFEENVKNYMANFYPAPPQVDKSVPNAVLADILRENKCCIPLISKVEESYKLFAAQENHIREPFASISHHDLWINNFMVKNEGNKIVHNKFVDFQTCTYDSPVRDLTFFLFSSVQLNILKEHLDDLLQYYHQRFIETLKDLGCSVEEFSYEKFNIELKHYGIYEIHHILFMLLFILTAKKGGNKPQNKKGGPPIPPLPTQDEVPFDAKVRAWWILQEFGRKNWL